MPWQKVGDRRITDGAIRLEMAKRAFAPIPEATVSDIELRRSGNSYTIDTLESLAKPGTELFLLLGSDAAGGLDTWERYSDVADAATIVVFPRRGAEGEKPPPGFSWIGLDLPGLEISSTDIRRRTRDGQPIVGLTAPSVHEIITREFLYLDAGGSAL